MSKQPLYKKVWADEELRNNKVNQETVKMVLEAFGRHITKEIKENKSFTWRGKFTIKAVKSGGWNITSVRTGEQKYVEEYTRLYLKPSKNLKSEIDD